MLSAAYDGRSSDEKPSFRYMLFKWRRAMHVDPLVARKVPLDVVVADLEYISIERTIRAAKSEQSNA